MTCHHWAMVVRPCVVFVNLTRCAKYGLEFYRCSLFHSQPSVSSQLARFSISYWDILWWIPVEHTFKYCDNANIFSAAIMTINICDDNYSMDVILDLGETVPFDGLAAMGAIHKQVQHWLHICFTFLSIVCCQVWLIVTDSSGVIQSLSAVGAALTASSFST